MIRIQPLLVLQLAFTLLTAVTAGGQKNAGRGLPEIIRGNERFGRNSWSRSTLPTLNAI